MTDDEKFMKEALKQAKKAYAIDEVPIGCVIVQNGKIIARGYNRRNIDKNTLAHAELSAIRKASKKTGDWRLEDCDLYVTLEPCQMCRCNCTIPYAAGNHRFHESQSRMCGICPEPSANAAI